MNRKKLTAQDSALRPVETDRGMIDVPYLVLTVLLVVIGLIMLFSASYARAYYKTGNSAKYFISQLMFAVMGMGVLFLFCIEAAFVAVWKLFSLSGSGANSSR